MRSARSAGAFIVGTLVGGGSMAVARLGLGLAMPVFILSLIVIIPAVFARTRSRQEAAYRVLDRLLDTVERFLDRRRVGWRPPSAGRPVGLDRPQHSSRSRARHQTAGRHSGSHQR